MYHLSIPYEAQTLQLHFSIKSGNCSLGNLAESITSLNPKVKKVTFQTLDKAIIPKNELMRNRNNIPFVMELESTGSDVRQRYAINLNQSFSITNKNEAKAGEEKYLEYCLGIGLPTYHSFMLANFASKFHQTLPQHTHFSP